MLKIDYARNLSSSADQVPRHKLGKFCNAAGDGSRNLGVGTSIAGILELGGKTICRRSVLIELGKGNRAFGIELLINSKLTLRFFNWFSSWLRLRLAMGVMRMIRTSLYQWNQDFPSHCGSLRLSSFDAHLCCPCTVPRSNDPITKGSFLNGNCRSNHWV